ncbi:hypothetical protein [Peribacillus deserti]|uniref:Uncharacterized protein n=1 Tax=Peribacillus deserti TaxID=673318 RepID=A0A2N5M695_9BACI|nr:hypothetical protein [Peribacillus deserti]PLT29888.1 hypothetical protein CUU66_10110 [Peribacillus deserti]
MGIHFKIVGNKKRAVEFEDRIDGYLRGIHGETEFSYLLQLDPYEYKLLTEPEIQNLLKVCDFLIQTYSKDDWYHNRVRKFGYGLRDLCLIALANKDHMEALGD